MGKAIVVEWECRMRAVKRCVTKHSSDREFLFVYISADIAKEMWESSYHRDSLTGPVWKDTAYWEDTTYEGIPLRVDDKLPSGSVVYICNEEKTDG